MRAADLARTAGHSDVACWWTHLAGVPGPTPPLSIADFEALSPGERDRIIAQADMALEHKVRLLGSDLTDLGPRIDWSRDFKTGHTWPSAFCKSLEYTNLDRPSDVKIPWELSRMQWLIPVGQAYALTGEERYADEIRSLIDDWIAANPHAASINWACTMDVALRAIVWIWFFHVFARSEAWSDPAFRARFLKHLFLHGDFVSRHLEKADVNGNHYTADAAGLAMIGQFFGGLPRGRRWRDDGWSILQGEILLQVFPDGVDFEASVPYHRLVLELFLWPALYRQRARHPVEPDYFDRLAAMTRFTEAYTRADGSAPLWGDADDARVLPFGDQQINDHRYLIGLVGLALGDDALVSRFSGPRSEILWALGDEPTSRLPTAPARRQTSQAFPDGGFFVLRDERNHTFIDCGPLGLGGRGGHGHNDLLAFEAAIDGITLISDCGAYLYTADFRERNAFRSTAYHNTPQVDGEEIYRFTGERELWTLRDDAMPMPGEFEAGETESSFACAHTGYLRLADPVLVRRRFILAHHSGRLTIEHGFECAGSHVVEVPFHFAPGVKGEMTAQDSVALTASGERFALRWRGAGWTPSLEQARVSPSYGIAVRAQKLVLRSTGRPGPLTVELSR